MLNFDSCEVVMRRRPENPVDMSTSLSINDKPETITTQVTCTVSVCKSRRVAVKAHLLWNCARAMDVMTMSEVAADEAVRSCLRIRLVFIPHEASFLEAKRVDVNLFLHDEHVARDGRPSVGGAYHCSYLFIVVDRCDFPRHGTVLRAILNIDLLAIRRHGRTH